MSGLNAPQRRRRLRSVLRRGHLGVALVAVTLASASMTLLGVLALKVYADHNLHLIARSINYTVEAAVVFNDSRFAFNPTISLEERLERILYLGDKSNIVAVYSAGRLADI